MSFCWVEIGELTPHRQQFVAISHALCPGRFFDTAQFRFGQDIEVGKDSPIFQGPNLLPDRGGNLFRQSQHLRARARVISHDHLKKDCRFAVPVGAERGGNAEYIGRQRAGHLLNRREYDRLMR